MSGQRALITGATGFVGACLARRLLEDGHRVELIVRPRSDRWRLDELDDEVVVHETDLRDRDTVRAVVEEARPEWIFHLAAHGAYSWQTDARAIFESNVLGTLSLAEACISRGFDAFVQAGSSSEYGCKDHAPSEEEIPEPNSHYAVAKVAATLLCRNLAASHGLHMATLRLYSVYGSWEDPRRLMPTLVAHGLRGELPPLVDPDTARDFVHVDDVSDAFLRAAHTRAGTSDHVYNVGSGVQTTLRAVVESAREVFDIEAQPQWGTHEPRAWDTDVWMANPSKIERELGWRPQRDLAGGLRGLAAWLEEHPELWERYGVTASPDHRWDSREHLPDTSIQQGDG